MPTLPSFAPFPKAEWYHQLDTQHWQTWLALSHAYDQLSDQDFAKHINHDESIIEFVTTILHQAASPQQFPLEAALLLKAVFRLTTRLLNNISLPRPQLLAFDFLADLSKTFPKPLTAPVLSSLFSKHVIPIEASLCSFKKLVTPDLDAGIKGDLRHAEAQLLRLNHLLHASPHACALILAGDDFFDGLVTCFRVMNPPLRKVIITTMYLCIIGLTEMQPPRWAMLSDQLYKLNAAAEAHKAGPLNERESLVPELVTSTPLLRVLTRKASTAAGDAVKNRIAVLQTFRKGPMVKPKRLVVRRKQLDKGKQKQTDGDGRADMDLHKMSNITQIQDLLPDLGAGFVAKCLDEYADNVEAVVANILSDTLPPYLSTADRTESLSSPSQQQQQLLLVPTETTPQQLPKRVNVFDDDDFDRLTADTSKISFGKKSLEPEHKILSDHSGKAAILSALSALDLDDDERDDTYDAADVGGTVDNTTAENDPLPSSTTTTTISTSAISPTNEAILFQTWQSDPTTFSRDPSTRKSEPRARLRLQTNLTDEALEGWALMLSRNPSQQKRLEARYALSLQPQRQLQSTRWKQGDNDDDDDGAGAGAGGAASRGRNDRGRGGRLLRGSGQTRGGGGGRGNVAGPTGDKDTEQARRRKEASKGSRANHNRREGRARKMARGGFAG